MAGDLQLRAAIVGNLEVEIKAARDFFEDCARRAVFETAAEFQSLRRADWSASGIKRAQALQKTIRLRKYNNKGSSPAALVYSTIPIIEQAFERGETIHSKEGGFLLIPNPEVWGTNRVSVKRGRGRASALEIADRRFGRLRFVYRRGNLSLLVADARESKTKAGMFRRASKSAEKTGRGLVTIIVFFLVPQVKLRRRLHGDVLRKRWEHTGPVRIQQKFIRYFDEGGAGGQKALPAPVGE